MDVTTDAIATAIDGLHAIENTIRLKLLEHIVANDEREAWREDGARSMTDWLSFRHGYARRFASDLLRVGHALKELPAITTAFGDGRLSWDKVVLITQVATPDSDALWASESGGLSVARLESWVRHHRRVQREEAERRLEQRYLRTWWDEKVDGLRVNGLIPGADGATVKKVLERIAEGAPRDPSTGGYPTNDHRYADALVELASCRLAEDGVPDRATVVVHVDVRELNKIHGSALLEDGPSIVSETARRLACDGRVQVSVDGPDGVPLGIGRTRRAIPPWLDREIKRRDRGCRFADCGATRGLHVHHIHNWAHGGPTDVDNLVCLCRYHHRLVHEGGWRLIKDSSDRLRFVRPDGIPLAITPQPLNPHIKERMFGTAPARAGPA